MANPIRWGILGAAKFAREHMGPAIHAASGAELAALATSSPEKAAPFEGFAPGLKVFDSYEALLADDSIEAIFIPLPNSLHVEWTLKALEAGKHVLTEKPIAMHASEFDTLIAARDAAGLLAAEAYMIVHHPQWHRASALLAEGAIGRLVHVDAVFTYDNREEANIRNQASLGGGGLRDIGVYTFGSVRFVTGEEPDTLTADVDYEHGVDTVARIAARFPSFSYSALVSMRAHLRQEVTFHGEDGIMRLPAPFNPGSYGEGRIELTRGADITIERWPRGNQYVTQVEAFGRSIREGIPYPCPLEFVRGTQEMIDRAFASCPAPG